MKHRKLTIVLLLAMAFSIAWPLVVAFIVHPLFMNWNVNGTETSSADLQLFLDVRRYEVLIPEDKDNWFLGLTSIVDGEEQVATFSTFAAGSTVVLLIQPSNEPHLKYCWNQDGSVVRGKIKNPFEHSNVTMERRAGNCKPGDWLIRGGRKTISSNQPAEFELRVTLSPPDQG